MTVTFKADNHKYESLNTTEIIDWLSVTKFVGMFKLPFDPVAQSIKSSKNKKSKWFGIEPEVIQALWADEGTRAINAGTFYHDQRESDILSFDTIRRQGVDVPVIKPIYIDGVKHSPEQRLVEGIYPEHFVYLKSAALCGQSDRVEIVNGHVDIIDYKTNKEIKKESFKSWDGKYQMMTGPCAHLQDCNFNHYALQLSAYMFIILKHNPIYKPGKLILHHVLFEKEEDDKFGNPIHKLNDKGEPIVKEIVPYELPYLKTEIRNMINYIQENKDVLKR